MRKYLIINFFVLLIMVSCHSLNNYNIFADEDDEMKVSEKKLVDLEINRQLEIIRDTWHIDGNLLVEIELSSDNVISIKFQNMSNKVKVIPSVFFYIVDNEPIYLNKRAVVSGTLSVEDEDGNNVLSVEQYVTVFLDTTKISNCVIMKPNEIVSVNPIPLSDIVDLDQLKNRILVICYKGELGQSNIVKVKV